MNPLGNSVPADQSPEQPMEAEKQALYNQLKMSDQDMEAWMFGDRDLESIINEPEESFPQTLTIGEECRLSESELWPLHEQYYANMGVSAWDSMVPCFITSSAYIAESYAEMILAFLEDHHAHLDFNEPLYILEMATGVGRFSHLLIRELESKLACFSKFANLEIRYLMTDFTENNVNYWRQHPKLQPYFESGRLDCAVFRPEEDSEIRLMVSGQDLAPGCLKNPLIAIANYFFDTIRQDMFQIKDHSLQEGLVTLERDVLSQDQKRTFPEFGQIRPVYRYNPVSSEGYYPEPEFNRILAEYERDVECGTVILPVGALRVLRNLQALSGDNLVLLSSDKAYAELAHMLLYRQHNFAVHGSFSYMVNYDAVGRLFKNSNGWYFFHNHWSSSLATVCCVATRQPQEKLERLQYYITQHLNVSNRITNTMNASVDEASGMEWLLACVRMSLGDPRAFCNAAPRIITELPNATIEQKHDLILLMKMASDKHFFYRGEKNLCYWMAEVYFHLGLHHEALKYLHEALTGYTEFVWDYYYMIGRSHEKLNQWDLALDFYRQSISIKPDFDNAFRALKNLETLMAQSGEQARPPMSA